MDPNISGIQNLYYSAILMAAGLACLLIAFVTYQRNRQAGVSALTIMLLGLAWWDITYSIFWLNIQVPSQIIWLDLTLVGAYVVPTSFLLFALEHTHLSHRLSRLMSYLLWFEPGMAFIIQWTDPWHGLFFGGMRTLDTTRFYEFGVVGWFNFYYSYFLIFAAVIVLFIHLVRSIGIYRGQTATILAAIVLPWIANMVSVYLGALLPDADITPFLFTLTAMAISLSVWYYRLLDITPIAYNVLFRNMLEGVVVLDMKNRVIEMNPIALNLFELSASEVLGQDAGNVFSGWGAVVSAIHSDQTNFEAVVAEKTLDFRVSPLFGRRQQRVGTLLVWRDITELKNAQLMLERLASVDELTGAMNRRSFMEKAKLETVRVKRANSPLSILIMDIDYFKKINDTHGHGTGDEALIHFSQICRRAIRPYDFFARIGGEEFAILLPEVDAHTAFDVAERLRFLVAQQPVKVGDMNIPITASFGIADLMGTDDDLGQVIRRADIALYCSKRSGRNQTQIWRESLEANSS